MGPRGPLGPRGLTLALFGPALANPSTTGPTWANPSPIRASGPMRASRNPSLLGSLGLRGLTLAHAGHPQPWEIPGVMGKSESTGLTSLPPPLTRQWGIQSAQCTCYMYASFL